MTSPVPADPPVHSAPLASEVVISARVSIDRRWPGVVAEAPVAVLALAVDRARGELVVRVDATRAGDPAPDGPPRACDGLWEHEVVELFVVGAPFDRTAAYVELELSPHGHWLGLELAGYRRRVRADVPVAFTIDDEAAAGRWRGEARVPLAALPTGPWRVGGFALRGPPEAREHWVSQPHGGDRPDFHRVWELTCAVAC